MSSQVTRKEAEESETTRFERNRYFNGKLMTARDMQVEQEYHRARLHAISQPVLGAGLVYGLKAEVTETDGRLYADIEPGMGLDRHGQPVVVREKGDVAIEAAEGAGEEGSKFYEGDEIYLFLTYDECDIEPVPVPDPRNACEETCCHNRVIEEFEVIYTEEQPESFKEVPEVAFPSSDELMSDDDTFSYDPALMTMAQSYYRNELEEDYEPNTVQCDFDFDCSLFLGSFQKKGKKGWEFRRYFDRRPLVYTNDMLYAAIARHVTDFENPHEVEVGLKSVEGVSHSGGNVDFKSPRGTIEIDGNNDGNYVDFDVTDKVARTNDLSPLKDRIEELENCVDDLKACLTVIVDVVKQLDYDDDTLGRVCDHLCEDGDWDGSKQENRQQVQTRQEREKDEVDDAGAD